MRKRWIVWVPVVIVLFVLFIALGGEVVQRLWNWLLPPLFGVREITFWQALGVLALSRILFGGFGFQSSGRSGFRGRMRERYDAMTPEERERFRQKMRARWGFDPAAAGTREP
jgi:hypothetical protein